MVRFPWWGGRGGGRCRGWRWRWWRWRRRWSGRGGRRKWPTLQPEAAEDCAEIWSTSNWYLLVMFHFTCLNVHFMHALGMLQLQKCSVVGSFSLVFFLRACEQKAEQPLSFWHPQIPSKKKPYKVSGIFLLKITVKSDVNGVDVISYFRVKKHAIHSSDTTSSSDEERFERRKSKSMTRARNR